jgi:uncharacterized iron-regulated membrane protein
MPPGDLVFEGKALERVSPSPTGDVMWRFEVERPEAGAAKGAVIDVEVQNVMAGREMSRTAATYSRVAGAGPNELVVGHRYRIDASNVERDGRTIPVASACIAGVTVLTGAPAAPSPALLLAATAALLVVLGGAAGGYLARRRRQRATVHARRGTRRPPPGDHMDGMPR